MCSHAFWAIYFWDFICLKSIYFYFPCAFFSELFKWYDAIFPSRGHDGQEKYQSSSRSML